jgi:hypothetical protein
MAERAGLSAQTFLLPQPTRQPIGAPEQPYNDGVQALEGLQYVKGQTADYYKKVADLKSFMQSVQQSFGVDVRVPDLSRPESIKLNQIYRDAIADIQAHGNELKQGAGINTMLINRGDVQTSTYNNQSAARAEYGKDFFNRNLEPSVMELNNKLQMPSYTREEYEQKEAARKDAIKYWENVRDTQPDKKEYAEYQLRGISPTTQGQFRPQSTWQDRSWGRKVQAAGNWLKKTANIIQGSDESYQLNPKVLNKDRTKPVLSSYEFANQRVGDGTVVRFDHDPDANEGVGSTTMIVRRQDGSVSGVDITGKDPQTIVTQLSPSLDPSAIVEYVEKNDLVDEYQRVDIQKASGGKVDERRKKVREPLDKYYTEQYEKSFSQVSKELDKMTAAGEKGWEINPFNKDDVHQFGAATIKKVKDPKTKLFVFEISNIKELQDQTSNPKAKEALDKAHRYFENTAEGRKKLYALLAQLNVFSEYGQDMEATPTTPTTQPQTGTTSANNDPLGIL